MLNKQTKWRLAMGSFKIRYHDLLNSPHDDTRGKAALCVCLNELASVLARTLFETSLLKTADILTSYR